MSKISDQEWKKMTQKNFRGVLPMYAYAVIPLHCMPEGIAESLMG